MFSSIAQVAIAAVLGGGVTAVAMTRDTPITPVEASDAPRQAGPAATTPPLSWRGVKRVAILCQVTSRTFVGSDVATKTLCERVQAIAKRDAPVPVAVVGYSDPDLQAPGVALLLVQGSISDLGGGRLVLLLTSRVEQNGALEEARTYFGAAPSVAPFTSAENGAAWDDALASSLGEVLPWLRPAETDDLLSEN